MLGVTVSGLEKFISTKTCVGEPIVIGDVTLIPIQTASFGYGTGGGEGQQSEQSGTGGGSGAGASLRPIAVVAVKGTDVQVFPLGGKGAIEKIVAMLPEALGKIKIGKGKKEAEEPKAE
ncbi:MAG TPA: sporulation protein [Firmicutes bacterium]|nr:sporulation protein [Candidatus Fermentithermobacillaceae bacterium]